MDDDPSGQHPSAVLSRLFSDAAENRFPPEDGAVRLVPDPPDRSAGVWGFTAHHVIAAPGLDPAWLQRQLPPDDLGAPMSPAFLAALAEHTGRRVGSVDVLTAAPAAGPGALPSDLELRPLPDRAHPRLDRALRYRDELSAWETDGAVLAIGRGVAGRWELTYEIEPARRGAGLGRRLALAGRALVPGGGPVWAQVAPGNAASVRAVLAAGFRPVGVEALLVK